MPDEHKKYRKGRLYQVNPTELKPDPDQPRKFMDPTALAELSGSVLTHGMLQPIVARRDPAGDLMVVAGERRYLAALQAGMAEVPVVLTDGNPMEISIVENLLREDLTAIEEAEAIYRLKAEHNYILSDLSAILKKPQSTLSEILSLNRLPQAVKDDCRQDGRIARSVLVHIAKQRDEKKMESMYQRYKENGRARGELLTRKRAPKSKAGVVDVAFVAACVKKLDALDVGKLDKVQFSQLAVAWARCSQPCSPSCKR